MTTLSRRLIALALALLLLTQACQPAPATSSPLTGTLSEVAGTVSAKPEGAPDFSPAPAGTILEAQAQVQTGDDGRARVDLSSGTIVRIVPSSLFTLTANEPANDGLATKLKLELGRIFIILNGGSLEVETPSGVASVRGSYMMVEVNGSLDVLVTCLEGNCSAGNPAGTQDFTGGQKTILYHYDTPGNARAPQVDDMNEEDYNEWRDENPEAEAVYQELIAQQTANAPTSTPRPTATPVPPSPIPVPSPTEAAAACVQLLSPAPGTEFGNNGSAEFSWSEYPDATKYRLTIYYPSGATAVIDTTETSSTRYMDVLTQGGNFTWGIEVLDDQGNVICQSEASSFSKPAPDVKEPAPNDGSGQPVPNPSPQG